MANGFEIVLLIVDEWQSKTNIFMVVLSNQFLTHNGEYSP